MIGQKRQSRRTGFSKKDHSTKTAQEGAGG